MRQPLRILGGAGVILVMLLVVVVVVWLPTSARLAPEEVAPPDGGQQEVALTPGAAAALETASLPEPAPTAVTPAAPPNAPARPSTPQAFVPLLYDDFSRIQSGWTPLFVSREGTVNGYSAESFAFSSASAGRLLYNVLPRLSFAPTRYGVDIQPMEGTGMFGLLLEVRGDPTDYPGLAFYGVGLTTGGDLMLLVKGAAAELQVLPVAKGAAPSLAIDAPARLTIDRYDDRLTVRVNEAAALTVAAPAPEGGTVGFFAQADDRLTVHFDNLLITAGAPGESLPCAAIRPLFDSEPRGAAMGGQDVAIVQRRLARLGYTPGPEGRYSAQTAAAVSQFQARNGLRADGVVGPQTWCALLSSDAMLASAQQSELAAQQERYRPVALSLEQGLSAPLLVSVRGAERLWQVALALPGRSGLHYIDTGGDALDPTWAPSQGLLAFSSMRAGNGLETVWIFDTRSGQVTQISPPAFNSKYPAWSPDGRMLMFTAEPLEGNDKQARNYVYSLGDGQARQWSAEHTGWSDWSSVGMVVFTRWTGRSFDIFVANADGSNAVNLTNTDDYHEDIAAWSLGGDRIAFVRNPKSAPDDRQIYVMQADGSEVQQITSLPGPNSNPIWLDPTTIVFANQPGAEVRQPYMLQLPAALRRLSASEARIWFMNRFTPEN